MLTREQEQQVEQTLKKTGNGEGLEYIQRLKNELRSKVDYIHEQDEIIDDYKHRAKVAERALKDITKVLLCSACPYGYYGYDGLSRQCDLDTGTCLENCLRIAEGELAEESAEDNQCEIMKTC